MGGVGGRGPTEGGGGWSWPQPLREAQREAREARETLHLFLCFSVHVQAPQSIETFLKQSPRASALVGSCGDRAGGGGGGVMWGSPAWGGGAALGHDYLFRSQRVGAGGTWR